MSRPKLIALWLAAAAPAFAVQVVVGGTQSAEGFPFYGCWDYSAVRTQDLVLQSDAVPAGSITKLEWHANGNIAAGTYKDFRVTLCHTHLSALTNTFQTNYGGNTPVRVFYRSSHYVNPPAESWFGWPFDTPFAYNGRDNFIIEVWWEEDVGEGAAPTYITKIMSRGLYSSIRYGKPQHGYPNQGELVNYLHHMRITISVAGLEPTSFGRVKTLYG